MNGFELDIPGELIKTELKVLAWTGHYFGDDYLSPQTVPNPKGDDIQLTFTSDRDQLPQVDAVWFHSPGIRDMPALADKRQPWVLMCMESEANYPGMGSKAAELCFDLFMTYRLDADIPCIYPNWHQYGDFLQRAPGHRQPARGALASYIASNPVAFRDRCVMELMQTITVDSLGRCLNNRKFDDVAGSNAAQSAGEPVFKVLPDYKFYLAFENSRATDYVTEKVFRALATGTVPVYLGASNVRDFMPDDLAVIAVDDFPNVRELAKYLVYLDRNDAEYQKHLEWKRKPFSPEFRRLVDTGSIDPLKRMAVKLAHGCDRSCHCGGMLREPGRLR